MNYLKPEMEIIIMNDENIITTSTNTGLGGSGDEIDDGTDW